MLGLQKLSDDTSQTMQLQRGLANGMPGPGSIDRRFMEGFPGVPRMVSRGVQVFEMTRCRR